MKVFYVSLAVSLLIITAVVLNCVLLGVFFTELIEGCEALGDIQNPEPYHRLYEKFEARRRFMSLSITHDVILQIEGDFSQMLGAISAGDEESCEITKSHLLTVLVHARRLSGINFDSVF